MGGGLYKGSLIKGGCFIESLKEKIDRGGEALSTKSVTTMK